MNRLIWIPLTLALLAACSREPAEPATVVLSVEGMTCQNCVDGITHTMTQLPGVNATVVELEEETATVTYRPDVISPDQLAERINQLGFTASVPPPSE